MSDRVVVAAVTPWWAWLALALVAAPLIPFIAIYYIIKWMAESQQEQT